MIQARPPHGDGAPRLGRSLAVAALIPLLLIGLALWFGSEYRRAETTTANVNLSFRQRLAVESLFSELKDGETGQRGYVITGNPDFLAPYLKARQNIDRRFADLGRLMGGSDSAETMAFQKLRALTDDKFQEMQWVIDLRDRSGIGPATRMIDDGRGKRLMDAIRLQIGEIVAAKDIALARNLAEEKTRTAMTRRLIWLAVAVATLTTFLIAYMLWHNRRARYIATRHAIDSAARQTAIFDNTLNAVILINPSGSMEILNPAAERLFGYPAIDLLRRDISIIADLAPGDGPFLDRLGMKDGIVAEPFRSLLQARRSDGDTVPVEVAIGVMPQDDGMHIVAAFRDISEREKVERMKDQFLSTVSHELRTPLTSIVGSLGLLRGGATNELPPAAQRLVVIAESNANRLIRIVNDLLDVEKLQSGQMTFDFHPLDLRDVVEKAVDAMRGLASAHSVKLDMAPSDQPIIIRGDSERLIQVITNLVSNAIKFSPSGARVKVTTGVESGKAQIAIIDQGPGIDADLRDRLFTRFAQGTAAFASATPGTGLGLTISREIIRNHGGDIWFQDAPGGGSVFAFNLPLWNAFADQEALDGAPRLLLYTDTAEADVIRAGFAARDIQADVVTTPAAALTAISGGRYLAMVLDFQFADGDAIPLLRAIRAQPKGRGLPVIAIAGQDPPAGAAQTASLDIIDWITKPIPPLRLDEAVGAAIERSAVSMPLVLHVDDDSDTLEITSKALSGLARIAQATDVASALTFLARHRVDIVIIDLALPDGSGLDIMSSINKGDCPPTPVIIYSAQDGGLTLGRDVEAVLTKSKRSLPNLVETVFGILERQK